MAERFTALLTIRRVCNDFRFFGSWLFQHLTNNTTRNKALCLHRFMSTDVQKYSYTIIRSRGSSNDYHQSRETEADKGFTKFFMFIANQFYALQILLFNPQVECVQPPHKENKNTSQKVE